MEKQEIERINELGRLSRERALTEDELAEQKRLREAYLAWFRASIRGEKASDNKESSK